MLVGVLTVSRVAVMLRSLSSAAAEEWRFQHESCELPLSLLDFVQICLYRGAPPLPLLVIDSESDGDGGCSCRNQDGL